MLVLDHVDLVVQHQQQPALGGHPGRVRLGQLERVQDLLPARAEQVTQGRDHPALAQHRVQARLLPGAHPDQLGPVPHQLAQLPQLPGAM